MGAGRQPSRHLHAGRPGGHSGSQHGLAAGPVRGAGAKDNGNESRRCLCPWFHTECAIGDGQTHAGKPGAAGTGVRNGGGARISGGQPLRGTDTQHEKAAGRRGHLGADHPSPGQQSRRNGQEGIHGSFFS